MAFRRLVALCAILIAVLAAGASARAADERIASETVLGNWYGLVLELVRHTATYSPPVASRAFGYIGVAAYESAVGGSDRLVTLAGQLAGLEPVPSREAGVPYDEAVVLNAALGAMVSEFFSNTGPTGQRAVAAADRKWTELVVAAVAPDVVARSTEHGEAVAAHVIAWSRGDGAVVQNMGFPLPDTFMLPTGEGHWVPTSAVAQQQLPLLPEWGNNRPFAMPAGSTCLTPGHPVYSKDQASEFYREALEVYETGVSLTPEQRAIAQFWSDDPMLSTTPPGHWISIALQIIASHELSRDDAVDLMARLGVAMSDAFIGCWHEKYAYNLIRPISFIRREIDPKWEPALNTPPFPEYPSGHSSVSGAAATVLTSFFGDGFAFEDRTGSPDGRAPRSYPSFWAAADEAGISRLYGGIHYRAAIDHGLDQGRCIGAYAAELRTRK